MYRFLTALILLALTGPARAADQPMPRPTRDIEVQYSSIGIGAAAGGTVTMHFANKGGLIRIDGGNGGGYVVYDNNANRILAVLMERRAYMDKPSVPAEMPVFLSPLARVAKIGSAVIAGLPCTSYEASVGTRKGEVCLTADGMLLRARATEGGHVRSLEATSISYAPQDQAQFQPPPGFKKVDRPEDAPPPPRSMLGGGGASFGPRGAIPGATGGGLDRR